jgi:hypothetical protein
MEGENIVVVAIQDFSTPQHYPVKEFDIFLCYIL